MEKIDKVKNSKKFWKSMINVLTIILFVSFGFICYSILLINGIENELRYVGMGVLFLVNILVSLIFRKIIKKNKVWRYITYIIILIIFTIVQSIAGYYIYKTYSTLDTINKNNITYKTDIVVLSNSGIEKTDDLTNKKIGILKDDTSIDGYILGVEIINKYKLEDNATVVEYDNNTALINDLYNEKIDAIIITDNYIDMFSKEENYKNIAKDTKILFTKEKSFSKEEIAKYTGDEILNLNKSNSITKPFTVLVMGVDSTEETLSNNATGNGDALMLVTFNPKTLNATILSIPRDSYIPISCMGGIENKITHAAWGGVSCMIKTIQNYFGINIDYYVKINFKGVVNLVDVLGGVTVDVPESLDGVCEQDSNRRFGAFEQCFTKGVQKLNGEQALAMARHRKTLATGDFERGLNQQRVVQGIINQLKTIRSANKALEILETLSNSMDTNFTTKQLLSFYDILQVLSETSTTKNLITMQQLYINGAGQMIYDERSDLVLYEFVPNSCSVDEVISMMNDNLKENKTLSTKEMDFDIENLFEMQIIGKETYCRANTYSLLPNVVGINSSQARATLIALGLKVNVEEVEITDGSYEDGVVIEQSYPAYKRVDKCNGEITIKVAVVKDVDNSDSDSDRNSDSDKNKDDDNDNSDNNEDKDIEDIIIPTDDEKDNQ